MAFGRRVMAIVLSSASFLAISGAAAAAQTINIPAEDLKLALDTYIKQSGVQLVYTVNDVMGLRSNAVQGSYQPSVALDEMLKGTLLVVNFDPTGAVIVSRSRQQAPDAEPAGGAPLESIVVTGSRIISDAANSPTPLTVVSTEQLQATTPSNIPDALNKLPVFSNSSSPTTSNTAGGNSSGNVLNLRRFGSQRTLVLLDGHRAPPSSADATVDVDTLPQMLVSRVDVVTGGASAVYGSDAVTGVVNFILDKTFTGVKVNANAGISDYGDGAEYQLGVAAGTPLFGGRGHIEGSFRHHHVDTILVNARPYGSPANWVITGAGTATNPYVNTEFATLNSFSFGGKIACSGTAAAPCAANGQQFVTPGVIGPFNNGTATKSASISIGGDGTYPTDVALSAMLKTDEAFGRFSYDINDNTNFYVQGIAAEAYYFNNWTNNYIQTGTNTPNIFFKDNPFLSAATRAQLANATGAAQLVPNTFTLTEYLQPGRHFITRALNRNLSLTTGLNGTLGGGKYNWDVFYTHGENRAKVDDPTNQSAAKMSAASDAVQLANGSIVCQVSQTQYANLYPGCVPLNPFGPGTITNDMYRYITIDTGFVMNNVLDDAGASISGSLFDLPAGTVKGALSGEMRWLSYGVASYAPQGFVDCTGLRLCRPETSNYLGSTSADLPTVSNNVWEIAGEVNIPLLRDMPLIQDLSTDIAGRYTEYSTSGPVETWKIGLDWHVNSDVRFRATNSIDIRAPTLNDLFSPQQLGHGGFSDLHTGNTIQNVLSISQGNAALQPEVARTYTAGIVLTPTFFQGFTASFDWYKITLKNAISSVGGNSPGVQQVCEASNGTSPLCTLFVRPLPFSDRTPANYPTAVLSQKLNAALNEIEGLDVELNYGLPVSRLIDDVAGDMNLRVLLNNQPVDNTQNYTNAPITTSTAPKTRITTFFGYNLYSWKFNLTHRWYSDFPRSNQIGLVYFQVPRGDAHDYFDINVAKGFEVDGGANMDVYLSVQNLLNATPNINPINTTVPGLYAAGYQPSGGGRIDGVDNIGRYFTIGVRARM